MAINDDALNQAINKASELEAKYDSIAKSTSKIASVMQAFPKISAAFADNTKEVVENLNSMQDSLNESLKRVDELEKKLKDTYKLQETSTDKIQEKLDEYNSGIQDSINGLSGSTNLLKSTVESIEDWKNGTITAAQLEAKLNRDKSTSLDELKDKLKERNEFEKTAITYINEQGKAYIQATAQIKEGNRVIKEGAQTIKTGFSNVVSEGKKFLDIWGKIDQAASKFAKTIGTSAHGMNAMRKGYIDLVASGSFAAKYGTNAIDLMNLQSSYNNRLGRNVSLGRGDIEGMAAMSAVMGGENAIALGSEFAKFGVSMEKSSEVAGRMFKTAGKYGLSFEKYSTNFRENMHMAQKFTFKDGLNGLESMARKATAIKLDMGQIGAYAEKLTTGGIEGAVETGANLQVLGGPFAQFSDPLQMLNEGLNDVEGLMDRFTNMTGKLGYFDEKNGQFNISTFDKLRLRQASQAMGMDYSQVMESVTAQARQNYIKKKYGDQLSDADLELAANSANIKNGKAYASYIDQSGKMVEKELSSMSNSDISQFRAQNQSESDNMKDIAVMLRGWDDTIKGLKEQIDNTKAQAVEATGIGVKVKDAAQWAAENNKALNVIVGYVAMMSTASFFNSLRNGAGMIASGGQAVKNAKGLAGGIGGAAGTGVGGPQASGTGGVTGTATGSAKINTTYVGKRSGDTFKRIDNGDGTYNWVNQRTGRIEHGAANKTIEENAGNIAKGTTGTATTNAGKAAGKKAAGKTAGKATGSAAKIGGTIGKLSNVIGLLGVAAELAGDQMVSSGRWKRGGFGDYATNIGGRTASYGATGAMLGSIAGPIGTAVGAAVGAVTGAVSGAVKATKHKREREIDELTNGVGIAEGRYTARQLKKIREALKTGDDSLISDKLREKMVKNGDQNILESITNMETNEFKANTLYVNSVKGLFGKSANGGPITGPSHAQGGVVRELEGGEYVINKQSAQKNQSLLSAVNAGITPRPIDVKAVLPQVSQNTPQVVQHKLSDLKISLDVNGSGNGGQDAAKILAENLKNNPILLQNLSNMIAKQININNKGNNVIEKFGQI